jgi:DNA-binding transcriptional ArsR family regulator
MINNSEKALDQVLSALANKRRRHIVYTLASNPASIGQLAEQQNSSLPAIHRHIKVLEGAKLVRRKKSGRVNFLALDRSGLLLMQDWVSKYHAYWGTEKETLENYITSMERSETKLKKLTKRK